jgi:hypothetical protein
MREREQSLIVVISLESIFDTYVFAHYSFLLFLYLVFVVMCTFEAPLMGKKRDGRDFFFLPPSSTEGKGDALYLLDA